MLDHFRKHSSSRSSAGDVRQAHPAFEHRLGVPTFRIPNLQCPLNYSLPTFPFITLSTIMSVEMALESTNVPPSKRQRTSDASPVGALQCQVCHRSYERADHLHRHLDSREYSLLKYCSTPERAQTAMSAPSVVRSVPQHSTEGTCSSDTRLRTRKTPKMGW